MKKREAKAERSEFWPDSATAAFGHQRAEGALLLSYVEAVFAELDS